jgi:hypothetical protein
MPVPPWEGTDGVELAVRGGRAPGARRRVQIARCRPGQWTAAREDRFLAVLSATCNVKAACAAVRIAKTSAYAHRRRWPGFAESWQEALREGAIELEAALLARGTDEFPWRELPDELADGLPSGLHVVQMTATDALRLLQMRFAAERRRRRQARNCRRSRRCATRYWRGWRRSGATGRSRPQKKRRRRRFGRLCGRRGRRGSILSERGWPQGVAAGAMPAATTGSLLRLVRDILFVGFVGGFRRVLHGVRLAFERFGLVAAGIVGSLVQRLGLVGEVFGHVVGRRFQILGCRVAATAAACSQRGQGGQSGKLQDGLHSGIPFVGVG